MKKSKNQRKSIKSIPKPTLILVASPRARSRPFSSLHRLVRDYSEVLKKYSLHSTEGTGRIILGTGIYQKNDLVLHRAGTDGGIAEIATLVARGECVAVILLLDPGDPWSDAVENRALKRVTIQKQVRLITTYAAAQRWLEYEALTTASKYKPPSVAIKQWKPSNWEVGHANVTERGDFKQLDVVKRSIALISHDKKKREMVEFVNEHVNLLARHHRILTTGTTGWLLKLIYASKSQLGSYLELVRKSGKENRLKSVTIDLLRELERVTPENANLENAIRIVREQLIITPNDEFTKKVMPLPSGPEGGDVLMANEVVNNQCHTIVFFHDPMTAHPHNDDIRLLEHTSQLPGVYAECVSDRRSAEEWTKGLQKELRESLHRKSAAQILRQSYNLREVILINETNEKDSDQLGRALARATAGYINQYLLYLSGRKDKIRVGVAWGWGTKAILEELIKLEKDGVIRKPSRLNDSIIWSPLIGIITAEITDREASTIAQGSCDFYGGRVDGFASAGFAREGTKQSNAISKTISKLKEADLIITTASPWDSNAALFRNTGLDSQYFPKFSDAIGTISGVFLDSRGFEVRGQYSIVGLDFSSFQNAAKNGAVVLMCGGSSRHEITLAALRGRLVSDLITTSETAKWIIGHQ